MRWLEVPMAVLHAYLAMLPRLRAQANLREVHVAAIGAGTMESGHRRDILRDWQRTASGGRAPKPRRLDPALAAQLGIAIVMEPVATP